MMSKFKPMRLLTLTVLLLCVRGAQAASRWDKPAAELASRIAEILGPGQGQIAVANRSSIAASEISPIRRLIEDDLRARGVQAAGAESANLVRVTLSETARERLWIAEIVEGSQSRFAMVSFLREASVPETSRAAIVLTRKAVWSSPELGNPADRSPVLAALETPSGLVLLASDSLAIETATGSGWREQMRVNLGRRTVASRDPRGVLAPSADGFTAYTAGTECEGKYDFASGADAGGWTIECRETDDPWPVNAGPVNAGLVNAGPANASKLSAGPAALRAFFNPARNFYTGTLSPSLNVDLPVFFSTAVLPGPRLIFGGIDGKVQMLDGVSLKAVAGTRDWGSDFAAIRSGCGSGTQVLATGSGEAESDSVRAYEIDAQEAAPASAPLEMGGTVTALWTAPDGASALAVVRKSPTEYEVARVAALCP